MVDLHPDKKPRKASELFSELKAVSSVVLPEWNGVQQKGEFGYALLKVLAMLSEQTSIGLAKTPLRDAIAFYNYLDVPPQAPQPAIAPLAFLLSDKQVDPVFAPAGTQIGAATEDNELIYETTSALQLLPGQLDFLAAVDTIEDRIEIAPQKFLEFQPTIFEVSEFNVPTLTNKGAIKLQVEPEEGLEEGDYIQFTDNPDHTAVYRLGAGKDGLFELIDPLEQQVVANSRIRRVTDFEAFALRNRQRHEFYLGHNEFLNLEQPSQITVIFEPADVAEQLSGNIKWALYGTRVIDLDGNEKTDWHPIIAEPAANGSIVLKKNWAGSVDEVKVNGQKNRWLRAWHDKAILKPELTTPTQTIKFKVKSLSSLEINSSLGIDLNICCISEQEETNNLEFVDTTLPVVDKSISQAFHNNLSLPLTTRFFPFGPEPQRFDIFALAAPEALSKKGAIVSIDVALSAASIASFTVGLSVKGEGPRRIYAIGNNGQLQILNFETKTLTPEWREIGSPSSDNLTSDSESVSSDQLVLDPTFAPKARQYSYGGQTVNDIVIAMDRNGRLWFLKLEWYGSNNENLKKVEWKEVVATKENVIDSTDPYSLNVFGNTVTLIALVGKELQYFQLISGIFSNHGGEWRKVEFDEGQESPELDENSIIIIIKSTTWPDIPLYTVQTISLPGQVEFNVVDEIIVIDKYGQPWLGKITFKFTLKVLLVNTSELKLTMIWTKIFQSDVTFDMRVRPAAGISLNGDIFVYGAFENNELLQPLIIQGKDYSNINTTTWKKEDATNEVLANVNFQADANFQVFPTGFGNQIRAVITGNFKGDSVTLIFRDKFLHDYIPLPVGVSEPVPSVIFPIDEIPFLLLAGNFENIFVQQLPDPIDVVEYHDALILSNQQVIAGWMGFIREVTVPPTIPTDPTVVKIPDSNTDKLIYNGDRVFIFPDGKFRPGEWQLWQTNASTELKREAANQTDFQLEVTGSVNPAPNNIIIIENKRFKVTTGPVNSLITLEEDVSFLNEGKFLVDIVSKAGIFETTKLDENRLLQVDNANINNNNPLQLKFSVDPGNSSDKINPTIQGIDVFGINAEARWFLVNSEWIEIPDNKDLVTAELITQGTNEIESQIFPRNYQNPELAWEYFDGDGWRRLEKDFVDRTENFGRSGIISFPVPSDLSIVEVAGQEDYFIRARLVGGDYGRPIYKVETTPGAGTSSTQAVTVDTSEMFPPEIQKITATYDLKDQRDPEFVFVNNNLTFRDQTQAAATKDAVFNLLMGASILDNKSTAASGRAIYFGFTLPVSGSLSLFADALDVVGNQIAIFEVLVNSQWETVSAADETRGFRQQGFITISINRSPTQTRLFGLDRYWLRARLIDGSSAWQPQIKSIYPNAVNVIQAKTIKQELLGSSTGDSRQQFQLGNQPVISESLELRIRENLTQEEKQDLIARFGDKAVIEYNEIDLEGEWVLWQRVDSFISHDADERVYQLDSNSGTINFGANTRVPPAGRDNIRATTYRSGGGIEGNVAAYSIKALKSSTRGVDKVLNPVAAAGGTNTPEVAEQITGSPALIRRADRALMPTDIEALLVASSPDIIRARCLFATIPGEPIRIAVAKRGKLYCPILSLADKSAFNNAVRREAWGALGTNSIVIEDPKYIKVSIKLELYAKSINQIASLKEDVYQRLYKFFNPIEGGPENNGWPFARQLWRSDVLRVLSEFEQLDRVLKLDLSRIDGSPLSLPLPQTGVICLEENKLEIIVEFDASTCVEEF